MHTSAALAAPRLRQDDGGRGQVWVAVPHPVWPLQGGNLKILVTRWGCWASVLVRKDSHLDTAARAWGHGTRGSEQAVGSGR